MNEYIRFGRVVERSKNHLTGEHEKGLSVYETIWCPNTKTYKIVFPHLTYSACVGLSGGIERKAYLVTGDVTGIGSDGEPLLDNVKILKENPPLYKEGKK